MGQSAGGYRNSISVSREEKHIIFWDDVVPAIDSWQFLVFCWSCHSSLRSYAKGASTTITRWLAGHCAWGKAPMEYFEKDGFRYLQTWSRNQDPLERLFGSIRVNLGSNNNSTVGQFQAALKTAIVNGVAFSDLKGANCGKEDTSGEELCNLHETSSFYQNQNPLFINAFNILCHVRSIFGSLGGCVFLLLCNRCLFIKFTDLIL